MSSLLRGELWVLLVFKSVFRRRVVRPFVVFAAIGKLTSDEALFYRILPLFK